MNDWYVFCNDHSKVVDGKKVKLIFKCKDSKEADLVWYKLHLLRKQLKLSHIYTTLRFPAVYKTKKFAVFMYDRLTSPDMYDPHFPILDLEKGVRWN